MVLPTRYYRKRHILYILYIQISYKRIKIRGFINDHLFPLQVSTNNVLFPRKLQI